ncbi:MAG: hypothetical protein ACM3ZT_01940 [Bacillota bacterium]
MKITLRSLILLAALLVSGAAVADTGEVDALRGFFNAVSSKNYAAAWSAFTRHTQDLVVQNVADSEKMSVQDVRKLFDTNDESIQAGFWESFRQSSQSPVIAGLPMSAAGKQLDADGSVSISFTNGNQVTVLMYQEGGGWKVGWMETFFPGGKVPVK